VLTRQLLSGRARRLWSAISSKVLIQEKCSLSCIRGCGVTNMVWKCCVSVFTRDLCHVSLCGVTNMTTQALSHFIIWRRVHMQMSCQSTKCSDLIGWCSRVSNIILLTSCAYRKPNSITLSSLGPAREQVCDQLLASKIA